MAEMRDGINSLDGLIKLASNAESVKPTVLKEALTVGQPEAQKLVRKYLVQQLSSSGIKSRTGKLRSMIKRSTLTLENERTGRPEMVIAMPSGGSKQDYVKANALNYGAVIPEKGSLLSQKNADGKSLIGAKQKAKLKNYMLSGKKSSYFTQVSRDIGARGVAKTKSGSIEVDTTAGKATITKAFKFFKLSDKQINDVKEILFRKAYEYIQSKIMKTYRKAG